MTTTETALGIAGVVLLACLGLQAVRLSESKRGRAEDAAKFASAQYEAAEAARSKESEYREKEKTLVAKVNSSQVEHDKTKANHEIVFSTLRRDLDGLRMQINDYAASGLAPNDTSTAASDRAATIGVLLSEALQSGAECAREAEDHASSVRALLSAWPTEVSEVKND